MVLENVIVYTGYGNSLELVLVKDGVTLTNYTFIYLTYLNCEFVPFYVPVAAIRMFLHDQVARGLAMFTTNGHFQQETHHNISQWRCLTGSAKVINYDLTLPGIDIFHK